MSIFTNFVNDKYKLTLFFILILLVPFSVSVLQPKIAGDSLMYTSGIDFLKTGAVTQDFTPKAILTTYLGLILIILFNFFTHSIVFSWLFLDSVLYVIMGLFFYSLIKRVFFDVKTAFIGTLFLITNYAAISFGLGFLMDIGGWTAYVASLYFSWRYIEDTENKWLYTSSLIVGIGGLYKEYSFVAYVVIFGIILWKDWKNWLEIVKKLLITLFLAFMPFFLMNIYTFYNIDHYTYLNWFKYNKVHYLYQNRLVEFIKSFGSIYNFGWFLFFPGLYIFVKDWRKTLLDKKYLFIWLTIASCLSVLAWPVVTRVLFITMPAVILISCFFIQKIKTKKFIIIPLLLIYVLTSYFMDSFVLNFVNLPF
jgi:hypothetical protein